MKAFLISGTNSGVGKTTISLGLMRLFKNRGLNVQPFKVGPDYIDPKYHAIAAGTISYNLDEFMMDDDVIQATFYEKSKQKDLSIVEGVMGLFDGRSVQKNACSSSSTAQLLNLPVILVIDGKSLALSAAALVHGYNSFDPNTKISGVLVNNLRTGMHYQLIKEAIETHTGVPCIGYIKKNEELAFKSRHLGLIPTEELPDFSGQLDDFAKELEETIDVDRLLKISERDYYQKTLPSIKPKYEGLKLGYFLNEAFHFYYQQNLEILEQMGVELIQIDPIRDKTLRKIDALYLGGGYPEVFAKELSENVSFKEDLLSQLESGLPAYAECGGLIYLCKSIEYEGKKHSLLGFFDSGVIMTDCLQRFGYAYANVLGEQIPIHEFHHTKLHQEPEYSIYEVKKGNRTWREGFIKKNVLASYCHAHFSSSLKLLEQMLDIAVRGK